MRSTTIAAFRSLSALLTCKRHAFISLRLVTSPSLPRAAAALPHHPFSRAYTTSTGSRLKSGTSSSTNDNLRQLEALLHRLKQEHAALALQRPEDISPRTPGTIFASLNAADKIDRHLRLDGHRLWGFVMYRCTYGNDAAWRECVRRIEAEVRSGMDLFNGHDLLQEGRFRLTVIEDAATLDGASTGVVRGHFREWCARMVREEQGSEEEVRSRQQQQQQELKVLLRDGGLPVRYEFCVQIDEDSMRSVVSDEGEGWVNLIKGDWKPRGATSGAPESQGAQHNDDEGDFTDDEDDDDEYPPIEGCTEEDVGWMKVLLVSLMPGTYANLRDAYLWNIQYRRPPDIESY
ncbi:hypothetical protein QBC43DRAFT_376851 [Cladorrhinum sp. PSN259]|nr:hypothetical protein QBC43DRAFT_376851 [Cladorrhinum sp. PSN259]